MSSGAPKLSFAFKDRETYHFVEIHADMSPRCFVVLRTAPLSHTRLFRYVTESYFRPAIAETL